MFERLQTAKRAMLLWSGGVTSTLILSMLRDQSIDFDIVQQRDFWSKEQTQQADKFIKEWKLKVFSYPSPNISLIGQGEQVSTVFEYDMPIVRDVVEGSRCIAELEGQRMASPPIDWDLVIVGNRRRHYGFEQPQAREWQIGKRVFWAPLADWSAEDILREVHARNIEVEDLADEIALCTKCLNGVKTFCPKDQQIIEPAPFDREFNLLTFKSHYIH